MNRLAGNGEVGEPCGGPFSLGTMVPSGICIGAWRRGPANGLNTTQVREWAKAQDLDVKGRGRVPAEPVVEFKAATGQ
jgi:hypothetical protein